MRALEARDWARFGGGDVARRLPALNAALEQEQYRRLLPGHVRRFVTAAAPLIDLRIDGDPDGVFRFVPARPRGLHPVLGALEEHAPAAQGRCTAYRPADRADVVWLHPGEPVFDRFCAVLQSRHGGEALRGACFVDPHAEAPYLFHLARVSVVRRPPAPPAADPPAEVGDGPGIDGRDAGRRPELIESRLIGLRQGADGVVEPCPLEHLLLLRGASGVAPGGVPLARAAGRLTAAARAWVRDDALAGLIAEHRARLERTLPDRLGWVARGFDHREGELIDRRNRIRRRASGGDPQAAAELARIRDQQRRLGADRDRRLRRLQREPSLIGAGEAEMIAHALVLPTADPEARRGHDEGVEAIALRLARAHEEAAGAAVDDVSRPERARRAGLTDWPGFDLLSVRPGGRRRAIEVKGRAGAGDVELSENEWAKACTLRNGYWLYVVHDCATPRPRLARVRDPFARLLTKGRALAAYSISAAEIRAAAEEEGSEDGA